MSSVFTEVSDPLASVTAANEILQAWSERRQAIGQSAFTTRITAGDIADNGTIAAGMGFCWRDIQVWLETYCSYFMDHTNPWEKHNIGPEEDPFEVDRPILLTLDKWRTLAGLNPNGFTRVLDYIGSEPIIEYGLIQAGDCRDSISFLELQKGLTALKWSKWPYPNDYNTWSVDYDQADRFSAGGNALIDTVVISDPLNPPDHWDDHCDYTRNLAISDWSYQGTDVSFYNIYAFVSVHSDIHDPLEIGDYKTHTWYRKRESGRYKISLKKPVSATVEVYGIARGVTLFQRRNWIDPDNTGLSATDRLLLDSFIDTSDTDIIGTSIIGPTTNPISDFSGVFSCPVPDGAAGFGYTCWALAMSVNKWNFSHTLV